ncbi:metal ABC transporter ATP-binding protein [Knoellia subterranea]|uniref:Zinc ABC transporter ATPase n=1 Tax=Knoellia subterranea KCTC 19937 TaxID=1385521 RepID=A0A0A0JNS5_9MICO|nr:metal ABC transporter ATP-binding protein [Knoellia subterranea]KGN39040.1 zinc ABC transporter ATPase [Knoellia subterranea KCTC 19937]
MTDAPLIELRSASFGYTDRKVVDSVSLTQGAGEVIALLGPNGSGKTTLVKGLLGLSEHLGGEVSLFGTPLAKFRDRPRIGYVPQRHSLSASVRVTVREIVETGRLPLRPWWRPGSAADAAVVDEALDAVALRDREREDVAALSGGQQRRVLIARALAAQPDVLLMDEPTAGVDIANQRILAEVLSGLADRGTSMLIVTHELAALSGVVTRIVCMNAGHVDFDGTPTAYTRGHEGHELGDAHHHSPSADERRPGLAALVTDPLPSREVPRG